MKRTILGAVALAAVALIVVAVAAAATPPSGVTSNGFETDTAGWFDSTSTEPDPDLFPDFGLITR